MAGGCRQEAGDRTRRSEQRASPLQAEAPVVRRDVPLRATAKCPHHGPKDPLELLPLLPTDHSCGGSQLPSSRLQPLQGDRWGPQPWGTPGPEQPSACQPPQELVCLCGDSDSELCP